MIFNCLHPLSIEVELTMSRRKFLGTTKTLQNVKIKQEYIFSLCTWRDLRNAYTCATVWFVWKKIEKKKVNTIGFLLRQWRKPNYDDNMILWLERRSHSGGQSSFLSWKRGAENFFWSFWKFLKYISLNILYGKRHLISECMYMYRYLVLCFVVSHQVYFVLKGKVTAIGLVLNPLTIKEK